MNRLRGAIHGYHGDGFRTRCVKVPVPVIACLADIQVVRADSAVEHHLIHTDRNIWIARS